MFPKKILLVAFFYTVLLSCLSQQVYFIKYTVHDGLVANPVRCIYQDSKGFIWIGTIEGLSRYDGHKFTNYTNSNGLSDNFINSIVEVNGKLLVLENNGAIAVMQNNSLQKELMLPSAANYIAQFNDRWLLTTDANGFYDYKNDEMVPQQKKPEIPLGNFLPLNDSLILSGNEHHLFVYKKDFSLYSSIKNKSGYFYTFFQDSNKRLWACTSGGLKMMQISTAKKPHLSFVPLPLGFDIDPLNSAPVTSMIEEKDGNFWIGTHKGLVHLMSNGSFRIYNEKDGLPSAHINTLYQDIENNLWIGTALGLAKWVAKNNVIFYNTPDKDFRNDVYSIHKLDDRKIILSTEHGLQQFYVGTKEFKDLAGNTRPYVPVSGSSPMLVHTADKIGMLDETSNRIIPFRKLDSAMYGISVLHPDGTIFIGSFEGVFAIKKSSITKLLPHRITSLVIHSDGSVWAGTWMDGLYRATKKKGEDKFYDVQDMTPVIKQKQIRGLFTDSKKNIWVGTRYAGAFCLTEKKEAQFDIQHFNRQSGLISDWVSSFAETSNGDMWVGSYLGIDKLVKEATGYRVFNFSKAVNFFADVKNIIPVGNNDWICHANFGIAYFKDENLHQIQPLQASILSASLGVLENKLTLVLPKEKIYLKPKQNTARFEFSALGFINERQILYSYRLKGSADTTWSKPENIHEAFYASLPPGGYTFEVKTIGWNGEHSMPGSFSFFIATPFWRQWWFISLGALAVVIFFYTLYRYRIRQIIRLQSVRNSIATDLHDDIGSSLTNISILSELSSKNISQPGKAQEFLQRISEEVHTSSQAMDDIIWSVNSHNDSLQETLARMRRYAAELFDNSETDCHLQLDENTGNRKLSMEQRRDVYLIYKEALTNIHKHARANNVWVAVSQNQNYLSMQIKDDGKGFNSKLITHRNGLKNLNTRVEKWNGRIHIDSTENHGTNINIKIPLKD